MSDTVQRRIDQLSSKISETSCKLEKTDSCVPIVLIAGAAIPVVIALGLYFISPRFVKTRDGGEEVRSNSKVFYWTIGLTLLLWAAMYAALYFGGVSKLAMLCKV